MKIFSLRGLLKNTVLMALLLSIATFGNLAIADDYTWVINGWELPYGFTGKFPSPTVACSAIAVAYGDTFDHLGPSPLTSAEVAYSCWQRNPNSNPPLNAFRYTYRVGNGCTSPATYDAASESCITPNPTCPVGQEGQPSDACTANKNQGPQLCVSTPNPIHTGTGNKYWSDTDYRVAGTGNLHFNRFYNSQNTAAVSSLGTAWRHDYDSSITPSLTINGAPAVLMVRANGLAYAFTVNGNTYTSQDADVTDKLVGLTDGSGNANGWQYTVTADDTVETYSAAGQLVSMRDRTGLVQTLTYSDDTTPVAIAPKAGLLIRVIDAFGRQLNFTYDSAWRINKMTDPAGAQYAYDYDAGNNLASVTYPDNKVKGYLYNEQAYMGGTSLPHALTGITDENGIRYASYYYNAKGKAYSEQHAGGVDQYQLSYSSDGSSTTITDPLGTARTTSFTTILGVIKATGQSQPGGSGCGAASSAVTYDANGNAASRTDFNGTVTQYSYDLTRNLETSRVEAFGTAQARTITTQWHATYRLPVKIAEPNRLITFGYDTSGNLLSKSIQAANDATGAQGMGAATVGVARTWTYTYNTVGQVLTATGPRTDVVDRTTYAYDTQGNLVSITNAAGHITTLSSYDANGRAGRITDPNGIITDMSYSARGWLTSRVVSGVGGAAETTSYDYDGVGQMTRATLPDGSAIFYTYDPAHRLTAIADSLGNSMTYTLDAMGNRTNEQVKDPNGALARQTSRIYDALNRLKQVTGGTL